MFQVVPILYNDRFDMSYAISAEGVASAGDRYFLRAKAVIAAAYMRGIMSYVSYDNLTLIGENSAISRLRLDMSYLPKGIFDPQLALQGESIHIGYLLLPSINEDSEHQAGWKRQVGWCAMFTEHTSENTVVKTYKRLRRTMRWLNKNSTIYNNICNARPIKSG